MKKYIVLLILPICILLTGCKGKLVTTKCHGVSDQTASGYKLSSYYKINSRKKIVETIEVQQIIESDSKDKINEFKNSLSKNYNEYNRKYNGYSYTINEEENKLIINLTIDYTKLDMEKFVKDNSAMKNYINDKNQLTLDGAKKMYESSAMKCEKDRIIILSFLCYNSFKENHHVCKYINTT